MGEHHIETNSDDIRERAFVRALLNDLSALEKMLDEGRIESGVRRIGAEQEMFLVDRYMRPACVAQEVLRRVGDARLTTEIARFNLEANLTPRLLEGDCLRRLEAEVGEVIALVREGARASQADVLLAGILPTLRREDLGLEQITPAPRYYQLNDAIMRMRGGSIRAHVKGLDEVNIFSDNIMLLSSNTSFQVHLQVGPAEFVQLYNMAQAVTAPVLAAAVNSPIWLGKRLWQETRLALFQHSADARSVAQRDRNFPTRVGFGEAWLRGSALELFREDIARFRVIMTMEVDEDPLETLALGGAPRLKALSLHNGTVWWWNRPCYGVTDGKAHLRIENRVIPAGPTVLDELANAAFFTGLMTALPGVYGEIDKLLSFDDAKTNFFAAARHGLGAQLAWVGGKTQSASDLILGHLLPLAREGLKASRIDAADIDLYLGTLEERVRTGQTGARWALQSFAALGTEGTSDSRLRALATGMRERQQTGEPVHRWPIIERREQEADWSESYRTVGQFMSTDLFTVRPDDLVDLAASVMDWRHVRHVPVEDERGHLVGLITHRDVLRLLARGLATGGVKSVAVRQIMKADPATVAPATPTLEAIELMRARGVGCLPVVENGLLVGIITAKDFLDASARLFEERLRSRARTPRRPYRKSRSRPKAQSRPTWTCLKRRTAPRARCDTFTGGQLGKQNNGRDLSLAGGNALSTERTGWRQKLLSVPTLQGIIIGVACGAAIGIGGYTFIYAKGYSYLTNDPAACANCHIMEEQYSGWLKSSHRAVAVCNDCHTPPGLVGKYYTKATNGFWHSYYFTTNTFHEPIRITERNRRVTEQACRKCHETVTGAIDAHAGGGEAGDEAALSCIRCHRNVGHMH